MRRAPKRILWVDDEIDLLRPHLLFLRQRGYQVDGITNGDDALTLLRTHAYDLVLLDEHMPGRRGLEVLQLIRRDDPHARVVMVTKSDEDGTMTEAIGRQVEDYLVKPTSPRQVLSVVTRILEGSTIRQQRAARDFATQWPALTRMREQAASPRDFARVYRDLVDWHLRLESAGETGLLDTVEALQDDLRHDFGRWIVRSYPGWMRGQGTRPELSVDLVERRLLPLLGREPVLFVILDCMRFDQWRAISPLLGDYFDVHESYHYSILPTATPYARNAIFSGLFPDRIAATRPEWWTSHHDEGSMNVHEEELLREQLRRLAGREVPVHYEKVFTDLKSEQVQGRIRAATRQRGTVVALVFNFVDLMTHGRAESPILMEVAKDAAALRQLTRSWFERSTVFAVLKEAAAAGRRVVFTTDHGSIHCRRPATVYARRGASPNLRYKFGGNLRVRDRNSALATARLSDLRLPGSRPGTTCLIALDDYFFVYPTKLREYQRRYRNSFLHGGISPEEMIVPVAVLRPRG